LVCDIFSLTLHIWQHYLLCSASHDTNEPNLFNLETVFSFAFSAFLLFQALF